MTDIEIFMRGACKGCVWWLPCSEHIGMTDVPIFMKIANPDSPKNK